MIKVTLVGKGGINFTTEIEHAHTLVIVFCNRVFIKHVKNGAYLEAPKTEIVKSITHC